MKGQQVGGHGQMGGWVQLLRCAGRTAGRVACFLQAAGAGRLHASPITTLLLCLSNAHVQVTQMLSSRTVGVPEGKAADGTALVVVLKGAVLEE